MGHRPVMRVCYLPSASPLQYSYCCYSQERPASQLLMLGVQGCLGALSFCNCAPHPTSCCVPRCATDHNMDNTTEMLQEWLAAVGNDYAAVVWRPEGEPRWLSEGKGSKKMGNSYNPERKMESPSRPGRGTYSMGTSHLFTPSGTTQTKRVPSTGPKKGTSF